MSICTYSVSLLLIPFINASFHLQILKILKNSSVRGLSVVAFELEAVGYTIALAYCIHKGLSFSAYGELLFLLIQGTYASLSKGCFAKNHAILLFYSNLVSASFRYGCS